MSISSSFGSSDVASGQFAVGPVAPTDNTATSTRAEQTLDEIEARLSALLSDEDVPPRHASYRLPEGFLLSVVIPVYNEEATVLKVVARVRALPVPLELIIVDDCSTDGTREQLEALRPLDDVTLVFKPRNEGKGAALRDGFVAAEGDVIVIQDADLEYDPRDILTVLEPIVLDQADVVYGSRFLADEHQDPSWSHRFVNRALTTASNWFTGLHLTDMETCYKAFKREVLRDLPLKQDRFGFEPEVTAKIARRGHRVLERPIRYEARSYREGKKIGLRDGLNAVYCIARYGLAD